MTAQALSPYTPRQPGEHWRTADRIFNLVLDQTVESGRRGSKVQRVTCAVCRYANDDPDDHAWNANHYTLTRASYARLMRVAPAAMENRK
jgi:hypothetical protein